MTLAEFLTHTRKHNCVDEPIEGKNLTGVGVKITNLTNKRVHYLQTYTGANLSWNTITLACTRLGTAHLSFGTLAGLLNHPERVKNEKGEVLYLNKLSIKMEQVEEIKYKWAEIANAIEILSFQKDIEKETDASIFDANFKTIRLTGTGLIKYYQQWYLLDYTKERHAKELHNSTIETNKWMKLFTGATALFAFVTLIKDLPSCTKPIEIEPPKTIRVEYRKNEISGTPTFGDTVRVEYKRDTTKMIFLENAIDPSTKSNK